MKPHGRKWRFESAYWQAGFWFRKWAMWGSVGYRKRMKV